VFQTGKPIVKITLKYCQLQSEKWNPYNKIAKDTRNTAVICFILILKPSESLPKAKQARETVIGRINNKEIKARTKPISLEPNKLKNSLTKLIVVVLTTTILDKE